MINPRTCALFALLNTNPCRPLTANPSALAGHIERTLVLQERLLTAGSRGIHASLRARFNSHVQAVNSSLCAAWEAAQEMIERAELVTGEEPRMVWRSVEELLGASYSGSERRPYSERKA